MRLEPFIAVRYLFARRQKSVVTVISWVSLIGLTVSTAALIVVLSVYNGIGKITQDLFSTFDPELVIEPAEGKTLHTTEIDYRGLCETEGVEQVSQLVDEMAWVTYGSNQAIVTLRGVDEVYRSLTGLDTLRSFSGIYLLRQETPEGDEPIHYLLVGGEVWNNLGMRLHSNMPAAIHIPKRGTSSMGYSLDQAFNIGYAYPAGYFFIQQDIDRRFIVADIDLARRLTAYSLDECTALAVKLRPNADPQKVKQQLNTLLNAERTTLKIKDRHDQQPLYFKIFRTERLGIYLILSLIVLISTLSLVASLSLLIINKRKDIFTLRSMGMTTQRLRRTFLTEGLLICGVAVLSGLVIGFVVCLLQQQFGIIQMGDGNFVVKAFPVAMQVTDFIYTFLLVMVLSSLSVTLTVRHARI